MSFERIGGRTKSVAGGALGIALLMSGTVSLRSEPDKALAPIPAQTVTIMAAKRTSPSAPLVIRTYKKEAELEIWKQNQDGRFVYIKTFPICRWSGQLGPKMYAGDRQTPEGFYAIGPRQMNPSSHYYLSFDTGFPNAYDKAHGASGSAVMVHGTCSSMGCFAMTDKQVGEIYSIAREALKGRQPAFQLQAYPFHMSARNMALYRNDKNIEFWRQLKEGSDRFESTGEILQISVVGGRYRFAASQDLSKEKAAQTFHTTETAKTIALVTAGSASILTTYADGGQNAIFTALSKRGANLGVVSRPEALAYAGIDVTLVPAKPSPAKPSPAKPPLAKPRLDIIVSDWRPDPSIPRATILKVRLTRVPNGVTSELVAGPRKYALLRHAPDTALISGAMPVRPQGITIDPIDSAIPQFGPDDRLRLVPKDL